MVSFHDSAVTSFDFLAVSVPEDLWLWLAKDLAFEANVVASSNSEAISEKSGIQLDGWRLHLLFALDFLSWFGWVTYGSHCVLCDNTEDVSVSWSKAGDGVLAGGDIVVVTSEPSAIRNMSSLNNILGDLGTTVHCWWLPSKNDSVAHRVDNAEVVRGANFSSDSASS